MQRGAGHGSLAQSGHVRVHPDEARAVVPLGTCASATVKNAKQQTVKEAQGSKS